MDLLKEEDLSSATDTLKILSFIVEIDIANTNHKKFLASATGNETRAGAGFVLVKLTKTNQVSFFTIVKT